MCSAIVLAGVLACTNVQAQASEDSQVDLRAARSAQLDRELAQVQAERDGVSRLWPLLILGTGVAALLVAVSVGAGTALSCDGSCDSGGWIGPTVLAGMGIATLGVVGLRLTDREIDDVESRRHHIERKREELRLTARTSPKLTLRVSF